MVVGAKDSFAPAGNDTMVAPASKTDTIHDRRREFILNTEWFTFNPFVFFYNVNIKRINLHHLRIAWDRLPQISHELRENAEKQL